MGGLIDKIVKSKVKEGYIVPVLDDWLFKQSNKPNDRAINVNAPSQAGNCLRHNYYMRKQIPVSEPLMPRSLRIFDNGSFVHERLQSYLKEVGILLLDEVPLINDTYNIQGHTDGYLDIGDGEIAILEIKSINDWGFKSLKDAKENHKRQGMVYLYCAEERRKYLRKRYKTSKELIKSEDERSEYFEKHYQHMKDGSKYSRKEKIDNEVELNLISDDLLFHAKYPITKVIFLYENKNDQSLKEFCVENDADLMAEVLYEYQFLNEACDSDVVPNRPEGATGKSSNVCRWCDYKGHCWVL